MRVILRLTLLLALVGVCAIAAPARARPVAVPPAAIPGPCQDGPLPSGAKSRICVPLSGWNDDLVVYAHGYVAFNQPVDFQNLSFGGFDVSGVIQTQGYAFATTSYRQNGLAVREGVGDIRELIDQFKSQHAANHIYLVGISEGGLVAALLATVLPLLISGALAMCGPIGDFRRQVDYFGDFRVVFDYFFPGVLPPSPVNIPDSLIADWQSANSAAQTAVRSAVSTSPLAATELISVTQASIDTASRAATTVSTTLDVLWYNVLATNDAVGKLGGNPYNNASPRRSYVGSSDDALLNANVQRFSAGATALANLAGYETAGRPRVPVVTLHTTRDPVIPDWHEQLYHDKTPPILRYNLTQLTSPSYGHCNFSPQEALDAFSTLVAQVNIAQRARVYLPLVRRP